jgi:hypothetical protein
MREIALHDLGGQLRDAALLVRSAYREASMHGSNYEAALLVALASLGFGIGTFVGWAFAGSPLKGLLAGLIVEPLVTLAAWLGGSASAWIVGVRLSSPGSRPAGYWAVARALALGQAPNLVGLLAVLPSPFRSGFWLLARFWLLAASSAAIRESLGLSGGRALVVLLSSAAVYVALLIGILRALSFVGADRAMSLAGGIWP